MAGESLFQQIVRVNANSVVIENKGDRGDLDLDISVQQPRKEGLNFEVTAWDLNDQSIDTIEKGAPIQIEQGWAETSTETTCVGVIEKVTSRQDGPDTKTVIKGRDESQPRLGVKYSDSFEDMPPEGIAREIAGEIGLSPGVIDSTGNPIPDIWSIGRGKPVKKHLDRLIEEAEKRTGEKWEYSAKAGKLNFKKKKTTDQTVSLLSPDKTAVKIEKADGQSEKTDGKELTFEALCEPGFVKGGVVDVQHPRHGGQYKIVKYEHTSQTYSPGEHYTSGTLADVSNEYKRIYPNAPRGAVRAYRASKAR